MKVHFTIKDTKVSVEIPGLFIRLDEIIEGVKLLRVKEIEIMATLQEVLDHVKVQTTALTSLQAFVAGLKQQLTDALKNEVTAAGQAKLDEIFGQVETNDQLIVDAMNTNVPPEEPVV